nr:MAG TPA: hypothetical protein [Caudoviricetes sp.]
MSFPVNISVYFIFSKLTNRIVSLPKSNYRESVSNIRRAVHHYNSPSIEQTVWDWIKEEGLEKSYLHITSQMDGSLPMSLPVFYSTQDARKELDKYYQHINKLEQGPARHACEVIISVIEKHAVQLGKKYKNSFNWKEQDVYTIYGCEGREREFKEIV